MKPFRKIVVATDFGSSSRRAVDVAVDIARRYSAELVLVHAVEPFIPPYPIALMPEPGAFEGAARLALEIELQRISDELPSATGEVVSGSAASAISDFAERTGADLNGSRSRGRFRGQA